jgi:hypothetical protein
MGSEYLSDFELVSVQPIQKTENVVDAIYERTGLQFDGDHLKDVTFYEAEQVLAAISSALHVKVRMIRIGQEHEQEMFYAANGMLSKVPANIAFPVPEWYAAIQVEELPELEVDEGSWRLYVGNNNKVKLVFVAATDSGRYQESRFLIAEGDVSRFDTARQAKNTYNRSPAMAEHYFRIKNAPKPK